MTTSITYIVEHPPLQHILLFKDSSENILYSTKLERHSFQRNKTHLYRGPSETGTHIATLDNPEHIRLDTGVEIVFERPSLVKPVPLTLGGQSINGLVSQK